MQQIKQKHQKRQNSKLDQIHLLYSLANLQQTFHTPWNYCYYSNHSKVCTKPTWDFVVDDDDDKDLNFCEKWHLYCIGLWGREWCEGHSNLKTSSSVEIFHFPRTNDFLITLIMSKCFDINCFLFLCFINFFLSFLFTVSENTDTLNNTANLVHCTVMEFGSYPVDVYTR